MLDSDNNIITLNLFGKLSSKIIQKVEKIEKDG